MMKRFMWLFIILAIFSFVGQGCVSRLYDRQTGGVIDADKDDAEFDNTNNAVNAHIANTAAHGVTGNVVGTAGTQTLSGPKTLVSPIMTTSPTAAGATWVDLGTVTTTDINGGTIDGTRIGATSPSSGAFTTLNATGGGALTGTWTNLGSVTTIDINGGTIDGTTIGASSPSDATIRNLTVNAYQTLSVGETSNCGWFKDAGVVSIKSASGDDLSATNPCCVGVPSAVNVGESVTLCQTSNVTFQDDDGASSNLAGWLFGVTTGVAWNTPMPVAIYVLNKDDTSAGLAFGVSRNPIASSFVTNDIGDIDTVATNNAQTSIFVAKSITLADYNGKPAVRVGATTMKKVAAANDWTLADTNAGRGFGNFAEIAVFGGNYIFPRGQNGASASSYILPNAGTEPTDASDAHLYSLNVDGTFHYWRPTTQANGGVGAESVNITCPFTFLDGVAISGTGLVGAIDWVVAFPSGSNHFIVRRNDNGNAVTNADFDNAGSSFHVTGKAF